MDSKTLKAYKKINDLINGDYAKLCDRYQNLVLSHNRKKKALQKIVCICKERLGSPISFEYEMNKQVDLSKATVASESDFKLIGDFLVIFDVAENALFCDGRERSK